MQYVVSYDLKAGGTNHEDVLAAISNLGESVKLLSAFWFLRSDCSLEEVRDYIASTLYPKDDLVVVKVDSLIGWGIDPPLWCMVLASWSEGGATGLESEPHE